MEENNPKYNHQVSEKKEIQKATYPPSNRVYLIALLVVLVLAFVGLIGGYLYQRFFTNQETIRLTDSELREKANKKYEELRGVSFEEEKNARLNIIETVTNQTTANGANTRITTSSEKNLATDTAKKVAEKANSKNNIGVYYFETEAKFNSQPEDSYFLPYKLEMNLPGFDYKKPFTVKSWISPCSGKYVINQNAKVLNYSSYTSKMNIQFLGGKYAVKSVYNDDDFGIGCIDDNGIFSNPDLEFVRVILSRDSGFTKIGDETINGVKVVVYEQKSVTPIPLIEPAMDADVFPKETNSNQKVRYYVDLNKFQVLKREYFSNDNLIYTETLISSKVFESKGISEIESTNELKGLEIKEVKVDLTKTIFNTESKIADALGRFPVVYPNNPDETISNMYLYEDASQDEYSKLTQTKDFNPLWGEKRSDIKYTPVYASYAGNSFSVSVYKTEPIQNKRPEIKKVNKEITIDGKKVNAKLLQFGSECGMELEYKNRAECSTLLAPANSGSIEFEYNNFWYEIGFWGLKNEKLINPANESISLVSLTIEKAREIDKKNEFIKASQPQISYMSKLQDIKQSSRFLPGDLEGSYGLRASFLEVDGTPDKKSTCVQVQKSDRLFGIGECLIDNYDGFRLTFSKNFSQKDLETPLGGDFSSGSSALSFSGEAFKFYVLKASYASLTPYLQELPIEEKDSYDYREVDGYTILVLGGYISRDQRKSILEITRIDKDLLKLDQQLDQNKSVPLKVPETGL